MGGTEARVLVIDDDAEIRRGVKRLLSARSHVVDVAATGRSGIEFLEKSRYDVTLVDLGMPEVDGFEVMKYAQLHQRSNAILVITGQASIDVAVRAMRAGATDFLTKPLFPDAVVDAVEKTLRQAHEPDELVHEISQWRDRYAPDFAGDHPHLLQLIQLISRVSPTDCDVLVTGESGVGKELVARAIHAGSPRADKPFLALNCAAIPKDLLESEIFGHAKGAFTGAQAGRLGKMEAANNGTLFLDEIGELEPAMQSKFLRVLQERELTRVGESTTRQVNVRVVSATNQNLEALCDSGQFRWDLFYRINVVPLEVPPLRLHRSDVPLLAGRFLGQANERFSRTIPGFDKAAEHAMTHYDWPGNVRELRNLVDRMVVLKAKDSAIDLSDLPGHLHDVSAKPAASENLQQITLPATGLDLNDTLAELELRLTLDALKRSDGNKAKAAELLGLKRTTLVERLKKLKLDI